MEGVSVCVSEQVCVFVGGGLRAGKAPSRCLLWSGDEELGVEGGTRVCTQTWLHDKYHSCITRGHTMFS